MAIKVVLRADGSFDMGDVEASAFHNSQNTAERAVSLVDDLVRLSTISLFK